MTFADFEAKIHDELGRMLGPGGFLPDRDIAAITVNRWPHGYGYVENSLFDPENYGGHAPASGGKDGGASRLRNFPMPGATLNAHLAIDQAARCRPSETWSGDDGTIGDRRGEEQ